MLTSASQPIDPLGQGQPDVLHALQWNPRKLLGSCVSTSCWRQGREQKGKKAEKQNSDKISVVTRRKASGKVLELRQVRGYTGTCGCELELRRRACLWPPLAKDTGALGIR